MIDKSKDKVGYLKDRFNDCIKNGYEHFGFEGDFSFVFDDTARITEDDIRHYEQICEACNSNEFYDKLHENAVTKKIDDIDLYEQCMREYFNCGAASPFVKLIHIMGRKDKTLENILKKELEEFLAQRQKTYEDISDEKIVKEKNAVDIEEFISNKSKEENFSQAISRLIDASGKKDSEIYRKALVSKATFSNMRSGSKVTKMTALQLCIALELDYEQTQAILLKDGVALGNDTSDSIFEFYIRKGIYDLDIINDALYSYNCKTIIKKD